jgi:hypothetical protein
MTHTATDNPRCKGAQKANIFFTNADFSDHVITE